MTFSPYYRLIFLTSGLLVGASPVQATQYSSPTAFLAEGDVSPVTTTTNATAATMPDAMAIAESEVIAEQTVEESLTLDTDAHIVAPNAPSDSTVFNSAPPGGQIIPPKHPETVAAITQKPVEEPGIVPIEVIAAPEIVETSDDNDLAIVNEFSGDDPSPAPIALTADQPGTPGELAPGAIANPTTAISPDATPSSVPPVVAQGTVLPTQVEETQTEVIEQTQEVIETETPNGEVMEEVQDTTVEEAVQERIEENQPNLPDPSTEVMPDAVTDPADEIPEGVEVSDPTAEDDTTVEAEEAPPEAMQEEGEELETDAPSSFDAPAVDEPHHLPHVFTG